MTVMEKNLTVEEVAKELRVSPDTVWKLLKRKDLIGFKVAGAWRIARDDLDKYVEEQKKKQHQTK